ncbi:hypothetical protein DPMN_181372 [Dreissena polymorpha]|uniref:Uncharacterized protein n=1 Tax=Dreissena polymorpha TaxID=45954 RepID=A0A9D4DCR7_DREPO|nr:hypothetical protein DPMN_181372 [Dreissena polymorpha]
MCGYILAFKAVLCSEMMQQRHHTVDLPHNEDVRHGDDNEKKVQILVQYEVDQCGTVSETYPLNNRVH